MYCEFYDTVYSLAISTNCGCHFLFIYYGTIPPRYIFSFKLLLCDYILCLYCTKYNIFHNISGNYLVIISSHVRDRYSLLCTHMKYKVYVETGPWIELYSEMSSTFIVLVFLKWLYSLICTFSRKAEDNKMEKKIMANQYRKIKKKICY